MAITSADVRAAREYLRKRGIKGISARQFARSAQETGKNFKSLLTLLSKVAAEKAGSEESDDDNNRRVRA